MLISFHLVAEINDNPNNRNDNQYSAEHNLFFLIRLLSIYQCLFNEIAVEFLNQFHQLVNGFK